MRGGVAVREENDGPVQSSCSDLGQEVNARRGLGPPIEDDQVGMQTVCNGREHRLSIPEGVNGKALTGKLGFDGLPVMVVLFDKDQLNRFIRQRATAISTELSVSTMHTIFSCYKHP